MDGNFRGITTLDVLEGAFEGLSPALHLLEDRSSTGKVISSAVFALCKNRVGGRDELDGVKEPGEESSDGVKLGFVTPGEGKRSQSDFQFVERSRLEGDWTAEESTK
jgi:hypothetical protein